MNDAQLVRGVQSPRRLLENFRNLGHGKRTPPREGLAERFAFQKLHGDVGRAVIGLAGFVNGDDVRVMNAARGSRFILKTQQEVGVIQQLAAQDFERHRTVAHRDLLGEVDRTHAPRAQLADQPEAARKTRSEMGVDLSHSGKSPGCSGDFRSPESGLDCADRRRANRSQHLRDRVGNSGRFS